MDEIADEAITAGLLKPDPTKSNDMNLRDALLAAPSKAQLVLKQKQQETYEQGIIEEGKEAERLAPARAKEFTAAQARLKTTGEDIASPMMGVDDKFTVDGKRYRITARDEKGFRAEGETVFWIPYKQTKEGVGIYVDKGSYVFAPWDNGEVRSVTRQSKPKGPAAGVSPKAGQYLVDEMMKGGITRQLAAPKSSSCPILIPWG